MAAKKRKDESDGMFDAHKEMLTRRRIKRALATRRKKRKAIKKKKK